MIPNRSITKIKDGQSEVLFRNFTRTGDLTATLECGHRIDHRGVIETINSADFIEATKNDGLDHLALAKRFFESEILPCAVCTFASRPDIIASLPKSAYQEESINE